MSEQPRPQVVAALDLTLLVPDGWWRVPLASRDQAAQSVQRLVDRQFRGLDDQPLLRREAERELLGAATRAADAGGQMMWLSHQLVAGLPLSASLVASAGPAAGPGGFESVQGQLTGTGQVDVARVPAGTVVRRRSRGSDRESDRLGAPDRPLLVDYWLQAPDGNCVVLAFSTPLEPLGEAMVELFDAVVASVRWQGHP